MTDMQSNIGVRAAGQLRARTNRGGARPGAGRKSTIDSSVKSFTVDAATMAKIRAWREARSTVSLSEALRQMVDLADRRRRAVTKWDRGTRVVQSSAQATTE